MSAENNTGDNLVNPFYAVTFASHLFSQKPITSEEDWLLLNAGLIEDMGMDQWLEELLDVLSLPRAKYDGHDIINPSLVVTISKSLQDTHQPIVTRQEWIQANAKLAKEISAQSWLELLLNTLQNKEIISHETCILCHVKRFVEIIVYNN